MAIEITQSEMSSHALCPWLWQKRYVELKRPKMKSVKLSFGSAIHKGIEAFYTTGDPIQVVKTYCDGVRAQAETDGLHLDAEYDLTLRKAEIVIEAYIQHYAGDRDLFDIVTVEPAFRIPLIDDIVIVGKIDRIVIDKRTGMMFPVESKTVASWDNDVNRLMLDFQISVYAWAMSKMLRLEDVTFIYDILKKPMMRLKKNEGEQAFLDRIKEEIQGDKPKFFMRDKITRSRRDIERTERELVLRARELVRLRQTGEVYRTPGDHCHWACEFMPPCLEDSLEMWESMYTTVTTPHQELLPQVEGERS